MSGAKPARRRAPVRKSPRCNTCARAIRIPKGWSVGAAVRRHYWSRHPEIMRPGTER